MRFCVCVLVSQIVFAIVLSGCATERQASRNAEASSHSSCPACSAAAAGSGMR